MARQFSATGSRISDLQTKMLTLESKVGYQDTKILSLNKTMESSLEETAETMKSVQDQVEAV